VLELLKLGLAVRVDLPRSAHGRIIDEIKQYVNAQKLDLRIIESVDTEDEAADEVADHDVCAYAPPPAIRGDLKIFLRSLTEESSGIILMLDGVLDPHNYGAILRTAAAAGVRAVIARDRRQAPLSEVVVKASAGMAYLVPIFEVTNLSAAMRELVEAGFWTVASARATQATPFQEFDWKRKLCLILGSEGKGVSQLVRESADNVVAIPLAEAVDSLNVSVAAGVLLFEAMRQQKENVVVADA
jgi:23S rRNA (guanosine2251-2'-O)-methyltransferase